MQVGEYEEAILRLIQSRSLTIDDIIEEFSGILRSNQVKNVVRALKQRGYIKIERHLAVGIYSLDSNVNDANYDDDYILTPLGKNYLANTTANFTSFSNISNSNIAHLSPQVSQNINISELPLDIRQKIEELNSAVQQKNKSAIKKAFSYIADKSVDVAIAILIGGMNKTS